MSFLSGLSDGYMRGLAIRQQLAEQDREELLKPYYKAAQEDQKTTIEANPNYRFGDGMLSKPTYKDKAYAALTPNTDFAPELNKPKDTTSPVILKQALPMNEWMSKYGWLFTKQIGADALPWAARTGEENRLVSLIKGGPVQNGQQAGASSTNQYGANANGSQPNTAANPTVNNYLPTTSQNELGKRMGFPSFDFRQQASYKPAAQPGFKNNNQAPVGQGNSQVADFVGRLNNAIDQKGREKARQWIAQNRNNLIAQGIDPRIAVTLLT